MEREKKIILVSHCILNQNSVVLPLARAKGGYNEIIQCILKRDIGILQLPCPEIIHLGMERPPMSKEAYNTEAYRQLCYDLLGPVMIQLKHYKEANYKVLGLIGVDQSPTCSLEDKGILMEVLYDLIGEEPLEHIAVPTNYIENEEISFLSTLNKWLDERL